MGLTPSQQLSLLLAAEWLGEKTQYRTSFNEGRILIIGKLITS
jgi:hypothetical protein